MSLEVTTVMDYFADRVLAGQSVTSALQNAVAAALQFARESEKSGAELTYVLRGLGFNQQLETVRSVSDIQERVWAMWLEPSDGGVKDVPHPTCVEKHLPKGRRPTRDELETAWELCRTSK